MIKKSVLVEYYLIYVYINFCGVVYCKNVIFAHQTVKCVI